MLDPLQRRKADILSGILLGLLGAFIIFRALHMPIGGTYGGVENPWYVSPAALPLLIGSLLIACGMFIAFCGIREVGKQGLSSWMRESFRKAFAEGRWRIAVVWSLMAIYIASLQLSPFQAVAAPFASVRSKPVVGVLADPDTANYILSSWLFLMVFTMLFYRPHGERLGWKHVMCGTVGAIALTILVSYVFTEHLQTPVP